MIVISLLLFMMTSCISLYEITVKSDGSASVRTGRVFVNNVDRYFQCEIISNIDTSAMQLNFDIRDIDSLGNYLPLFQPGFMKFHMDSSTLTVIDGQTETVFSFSDQSITRVSLFLNFNQEINLKSSSGRVYIKKRKSVYMTKSKRKLLKGDKKMEAVIELMPTKEFSLNKLGEKSVHE